MSYHSAVVVIWGKENILVNISASGLFLLSAVKWSDKCIFFLNALSYRPNKLYCKNSPVRYETNVFDNLGSTAASRYWLILIIVKTITRFNIMNLKSSGSVLQYFNEYLPVIGKK